MLFSFFICCRSSKDNAPQRGMTDLPSYESGSSGKEIPKSELIENLKIPNNHFLFLTAQPSFVEFYPSKIARYNGFLNFNYELAFLKRSHPFPPFPKKEKISLISPKIALRC